MNKQKLDVDIDSLKAAVLGLPASRVIAIFAAVGFEQSEQAESLPEKDQTQAPQSD